MGYCNDNGCSFTYTIANRHTDRVRVYPMVFDRFGNLTFIEPP